MDEVFLSQKKSLKLGESLMSVHMKKIIYFDISIIIMLASGGHWEELEDKL